MTHRIWSSVAFRPVLMAGIATLTIVVSRRIMKNPVVSTNKTSHGLVDLVGACAMPSPQLLIAGVDSGPPLQLSVPYLPGDLADPTPLRLEDRDLVLELDQRQSRVTRGQKFIEDVCELGDHPVESP